MAIKLWGCQVIAGLPERYIIGEGHNSLAGAGTNVGIGIVVNIRISTHVGVRGVSLTILKAKELRIGSGPRILGPYLPRQRCR